MKVFAIMNGTKQVGEGVVWSSRVADWRYFDEPDSRGRYASVFGVDAANLREGCHVELRLGDATLTAAQDARSLIGTVKICTCCGHFEHAASKCGAAACECIGTMPAPSNATSPAPDATWIKLCAECLPGVARGPRGSKRCDRCAKVFDDGMVSIRTVVEEARRAAPLRAKVEREPTPIPMRITCPSCGELHIDEGEFATKQHHTHSCQRCGLTWRPAVVHTVGVRFLPGFKNEAVETLAERIVRAP